MRTSRTIIFMAIAAFLMSACQSEDEQQNLGVEKGEQTAVKFELDASALKYEVNNSGLKYSPEYNKNGFSIYAFKKVVGGTDYVYSKTISLTGLSYSETDKKLTGTDKLEIGTYRFLCAYGDKQTGVLAIPTWTGQVLTDNFVMQYNGSGALGEIFVLDGPASSLTSYELGLTSVANPTVTATLKRAVSRVDIMFFKGTKSGNTFTEVAYPSGQNVFGNRTIEAMQLRYTDLNSTVDYFGNYVTAPTVSANVNLSNLNHTVANSNITIGNATTTEIGTTGYTRYDNVQSEDLINGAAHVFGNYVIPNDAAITDTPTAGLEIFIKPVNGEGRTITLTNLIPMERNKVTLVKIYALGDIPDIFNTEVQFEVEIETVWDGSNEATGEVK